MEKCRSKIKRVSQERQLTDKGLRAERRKADVQLAQRLSSARSKTDMKTDRARQKADQEIQRRRAREDHALDAARSAPDGIGGKVWRQIASILVLHRSQADAQTSQARLASDRSISRERLDFQQAASNTMERERQQTNTYLSEERFATDNFFQRDEKFLQRVRKANTAIKRARATHDELLALISHDLNNGLGVISIAAASLLSALDPQAENSEARELAEIILRNAKDMIQLTSTLLEAKSMSSGRLKVVYAPCDLARILADAAATFSLAASKKAIQLRLELPPEACRLNCDEKRIKQVISNLLANAIKYAPEGGNVAMRLDFSKGFAQVSVQDDGPGIPAAMKRKIFQRYYQINRRGGLGLGLFISQWIVKAHRGKIWVDSGRKRGSCFHFTLPLSK